MKKHTIALDTGMLEQQLGDLHGSSGNRTALPIGSRVVLHNGFDKEVAVLFRHVVKVFQTQETGREHLVFNVLRLKRIMQTSKGVLTAARWTGRNSGKSP